MYSLSNFVLVAVGGAAGASLRYFLSLMFLRGGMPLGTLLSNLVGCFVLGALLQMGLASGNPNVSLRLLLATGFCGGFTTMSAFVFEVSAYLRAEQPLPAAIYFALTLAGAFVSFYLGSVAVRLVAR